MRLRRAKRAAFERRKDPLEVVLPNAGTGVPDLELGHRAAVGDDEIDASLRGELDRVRQEVDQHLTQPLFVGVDHRRQVGRPLEDEIDLLCLRLQAEHADQLIEEFAERHLVARKIKAARFDLGDVQDAVDQPRQVIGAALDHPDLPARFGEQAVVLVEQLRVARDGVERRAQLVAEADHVAAFRKVGCFGRFLRALQLGVGLLVRLDFLHQQRGLPPGLGLRGLPALPRQHEQPHHDADDDRERKEHFPQHVGDAVRVHAGLRQNLQVDQPQRQADETCREQESKK